MNMAVSLSEKALEKVAERFAVLAEPLRLKILYLLRDGEMSVAKLTDAVGTSQPNMSKHLRILWEAGILSREKGGNAVYYSIRDESIYRLCDVVCASLDEKLRDQAAIFSAV